MDRALPGWAVDLIREGVRPVSLRRGGDRAVWRALVRTATSAHMRGWDRCEWDALLGDPRSRLGVQARVQHGKPRSRRQVADTLAAAWDTAVVWVSERDRPDHTREAAQARARERAAALTAWCADADRPATDAERAVLAYAAQAAHDLGSITPALPRLRIREATGLGERTVRTTLDRLSRRGLLIRADPGRSASPDRAHERRAATYRLPDQPTLDATRPIPVPGNPVCGTPTPGTGQVCGTPEPESLGPPDSQGVQVYGTPEPAQPEPEQQSTPERQPVQVYGTPDDDPPSGGEPMNDDSTEPTPHPDMCPHGKRHGDRLDMFGQRRICARCDLARQPDVWEATG